jgi:16S rRNA A1518/A1519 N6-dimethyltransferase RsmA/KsgA/DIM1 with predicted DNA glycosylase/AP lyase activity
LRILINFKTYDIYFAIILKGEHINKELYKKPWDSDEIPSAHLIGNLPFNISTPLLFKLLTKVSDQTGVNYF